MDPPMDSNTLEVPCIGLLAIISLPKCQLTTVFVL